MLRLGSVPAAPTTTPPAPACPAAPENLTQTSTSPRPKTVGRLTPVSKSWAAGRINAMPTARIWRRYGHLRIYISAGDVDLGWCDPRSGRFQLHQLAMAEDFWLAVRAECQRLVQEGQLADVTLPTAAKVEPAQQPAGPPTGPQERAPEPR